jgi:hypothetical protein
MTPPTLSADERTTLLNAWADSLMGTRTPVLADQLAESILAALSAVPRLREVEGMGLEDAWVIRKPDGSWRQPFFHATVGDTVEWLNRNRGPGHHAVRLGVVEVATPDTEEKDDG